MTQDPRHKNHLPKAESISQYWQGYTKLLQESLEKVSTKALEEAFTILSTATKAGARIYVAGNGGSAAISDHLCCDMMKGTQVAHDAALKVYSLVSNTSLLTALINDYGSEEAFSRQIDMLGEKGDVAILISSSGNSPNILKAASAAKIKKMQVIGFSGFEGGKLKDLADVCLYVPVKNYGVAEDAHQILMHVLAQFLAKVRDASA